MKRLRRNKYGAKKTEVNGIVFDSKMEANLYKDLLLRQSVGQCKIIELQPKVYLSAAKILYKPDFLIEANNNGEKYYIDAKGMDTPVFKLKLRLWKAYSKEKLLIVYKNEEILIQGEAK
jgi:hypothetical protein